MFTLRRITQINRLRDFQGNFQLTLGQNGKGHIQSSLFEEFLMRAQVYAVFNSKKEMLAGFGVNCSTPYRSLVVVPDPQ